MSCELPREGYLLIIAEKPKAARSIAYALSSSPFQCRYRGAPYWVLNKDGQRVVVAPVAGHLFSLYTSVHDIPVFDYIWAPRWEAERGASHTRKFYYLMKYLSKASLSVVNACDYDIEGSVIGYLVITLILGKKVYKRMKFSSLTPNELREAFRNLQPQDINMVEAGLCRHELDWIYGINLSRLLMNSYRSVAKNRKTLSVGRVQTPTLVEVINRYIECEAFCRPPVFSVYATVNYKQRKVSASYVGNPVDKYADARKIKEIIKKHGEVTVKETAISHEEVPPPPPFNLSDLQDEAYKLYGFSPSYTQRVAEDLYLDGLISYPRTNSQKLPPGLNRRGILEKLAELGYSDIVSLIFRENPNLAPREGRKTDPAHPAIYPTGMKIKPRKPEHKKLYDLIVKRFLASFLPPAVYVKAYIKWSAGVDLESHIRALVEEGWLRVYGGEVTEEPIRPAVGDRGALEGVSIKSQYPERPRPHTKSSILRWMESNNIGTEATRAEIIEILYKRGYVRDHRGMASPTTLGIAVYEVARTFFPEITSVELTRNFEEKIQKVREGLATRVRVVEEAKNVIRRVVEEGLRNQNEIINMLANLALGLGKRCVVCGLPSHNSDLCITHSKALEEVARNLSKWESSLGVDRRGALIAISKSKSVGRAARDIAQKIFDEQIII